MLSSSDAKSRCLWQMFVWSLLLCFSSQFLQISKHVTFVVIAFLSMIFLPVLTAIYSNTSGKKGAGLLRAGYVLSDPIVACVTVTPIVIFHNLKSTTAQLQCWSTPTTWNSTINCYENLNITLDKNATNEKQMEIFNGARYQLFVIQMSILLPPLLVLTMFRRTRKMLLSTFLIQFGYWFITAIETCGLIEEPLAFLESSRHSLFSTCVVICISSIITNTYAIVTLCSYLTPLSVSRVRTPVYKNFNLVYFSILTFSAICFVEIPLLVTRFRMILLEEAKRLNGTFYGWLIKDFLILCVLFVSITKFIKEKFFDRNISSFDDLNYNFLPEKRDIYIRKSVHASTSIANATLFNRVELNNEKRQSDQVENNLNDNFSANTAAKKKVSFKLDMDRQSKIVEA